MGTLSRGSNSASFIFLPPFSAALYKKIELIQVEKSLSLNLIALRMAKTPWSFGLLNAKWLRQTPFWTGIDFQRYKQGVSKVCFPLYNCTNA